MVDHSKIKQNCFSSSLWLKLRDQGQTNLTLKVRICKAHSQFLVLSFGLIFFGSDTIFSFLKNCHIWKNSAKITYNLKRKLFKRSSKLPNFKILASAI